MKGFQISSGVILLMTAGFLMQQIVMVSSADVDMTATCALMSEGFIADPKSCQGYGYCKGGKLSGTGSCPAGYLYNARHGVCDDPANVVCSDVDTACKYADDQTFVADPNDCSRYCYCSKQKAECTSCPKGQVFDSRVTRCVYASAPGFVCQADSVCRLVPNGVFLGTTTCGNQYTGCLNGVGTTATCPKGLFYNTQLGGCQSENPCIGGNPVGGGLGVNGVAPQTPIPCEKATSATPEKPQYVTDQATCMGYFVCTGINDPGIWTKCPLGLHFNDGECVTPYTFACQHDRCGNMNVTWVGAINTECKNFLICKDQTSQGLVNGYEVYTGIPCQQNYFFNEYTQTCSKDSPKSTNYKLCP
ncbi:peritrophin-44 [Calliphora vicina]|uniref:peritrophin-44 n=1 Tax=Calliphora vicina TaxID=7373 RepID=UPI00325AF101